MNDFICDISLTIILDNYLSKTIIAKQFHFLLQLYYLYYQLLYDIIVDHIIYLYSWV